MREYSKYIMSLQEKVIEQVPEVKPEVVRPKMKYQFGPAFNQRPTY